MSPHSLKVPQNLGMSKGRLEFGAQDLQKRENGPVPRLLAAQGADKVP